MKVYSSLMLFALSLLLHRIKTIKSIENSTSTCNIWHLNVSVVCDQFLTWSEVNNYLKFHAPQSQKYSVNIKPQTPIVFTDQLNVGNLWRVFGGGQTNFFSINIIQISGIEIYPWNQSKLTNSVVNTSKTVALAFEQSPIAFYFLNKSVANLECSSDLISTTSKVNSLFNSFLVIIFARKNKYPTEPVCPYSFAHANLGLLGFFDQINSILISNIWQFQIDNSTLTTPINSTIYMCYVNGYGFTLDTSLVHPRVFEFLTEVHIYHSIEAIQTDLFKHFTIFESIHFFLDSLRNFFHRVGVNWTIYLAKNALVEFQPLDLNDTGWINGPDYLYPEQDFCLFSQWPIQKLITPIFDTTNLTECTSTLIYIMSPYFYYNMTSFLKSYPTTFSIFSACLNPQVAVQLGLYPTYFQGKLFKQFNNFYEQN
jgi:hypothetical protein